MTTFPEAKIERLIKISQQKPLIPEQFIPWAEEPKAKDIYLPAHLVSLEGHPLYHELSLDQQKELGKHEVVQVMYSYGWSEGLACIFFNRHLLNLDVTSSEYRFLIRELIEEFRHQEMFSRAVMKLDGNPIRPRWMHRFWGNLTVKYLPADWVFMSVLAVEMIADTYGKIMRKDERVYQVLRKVSELHHIEEGRHIHYTKMWLKKYTDNAGWLKRSWYSMLILMNVYFMRTLYVRQEIFERIGVENPKQYQKAAYRNFRSKFADHCLEEAVEFVQEIGGMNWVTRFFWKRILKARV